MSEQHICRCGNVGGCGGHAPVRPRGENWYRFFVEGSGADWAIIPSRLVVALVFCVHGYGKLTGGGIGPGIEAFAGLLSSIRVPFPGAIAWMVASIEFFGGIAVFVGLGTRVAASLLAAVMVVAYVLVKSNMPFTAGEIDLAMGALSISLVGLGAGRYSLDAWLQQRLNKKVNSVL